MVYNLYRITCNQYRVAAKPDAVKGPTIPGCNPIVRSYFALRRFCEIHLLVTLSNAYRHLQHHNSNHFVDFVMSATDDVLRKIQHFEFLIKRVLYFGDENMVTNDIISVYSRNHDVLASK